MKGMVSVRSSNAEQSGRDVGDEKFRETFRTGVLVPILSSTQQMFSEVLCFLEFMKKVCGAAYMQEVTVIKPRKNKRTVNSDGSACT